MAFEYDMNGIRIRYEWHTNTICCNNGDTCLVTRRYLRLFFRVSATIPNILFRQNLKPV